MKKLFLLLLFFACVNYSFATIHVIKVWDGYMQFLPNELSIALGDTITWLPFDVPSMPHTVTSATIPAGAATFDYLWQQPADTFFRYVPQYAGEYNYVCTPHVSMGMVGKFTVTTPTGLTAGAAADNIAFPNPFFQHLIVKNAKEYQRFQLINSIGKVVSEGRVTEILQFGNMDSGLYLLYLFGNRNRIVKLTKE